MKYVSMLFAVVLFAGIANAGEFKFNYSNHNAYYACSYAEAQVEKTLSALGVEGVLASCTGGIDHGQMWPVSVTASYEAVVKGETQVVLRGRESCDFNVKLIKAAVAHLGLEIAESSNSCWDASGSYRFVINL